MKEKIKKTERINIRVTQTTKENLDILTNYIAEKTGYPTSQSDVVTKLINDAVAKMNSDYK